MSGLCLILKGSGPASLTIVGFGRGNLCPTSVSLGARHLFAAVSDGAGGYHGLYLGQFKPALAPQPELLAAIRTVRDAQPASTTGAAPATPGLQAAPTTSPGDGAVSDTSNASGWWLLGLVVGGLVVGLELFGLARVRSR
jgi:hypothetical protein